MMGSLKTIALVVILAAGPAMAGQNERDALSLRFATCLGRYSAQISHAYLMRRDAGEAEQRQRAFAALLDATRPGAFSPAEIMAQRIDAKMRFAALLQIAEFHTDPRRADRAARLIRRHLNGCATLVLG